MAIIYKEIRGQARTKKIILATEDTELKKSSLCGKKYSAYFACRHLPQKIQISKARPWVLDSWILKTAVKHLFPIEGNTFH